MATSPDVIRRDLTVITGAAQADIRTVANAAPNDPTDLRAALFAATPLIINEYADGAAALALNWFEELRNEAGVRTPFQAQPLVTITEDDIAAMVARTTESIHDLQRGIEQDIEKAVTESMAALEAEMQREVAAGFRDTITGNSAQDPESPGWKRFAQAGACKFCEMLSARGAVYTEATARFAAHTSCSCLAGPAFGSHDFVKATPMQYVASKRTRTPAQHAALRDYLNEHFPDAPG
jgi:hypothetical protein